MAWTSGEQQPGTPKDVNGPDAGTTAVALLLVAGLVSTGLDKILTHEKKDPPKPFSVDHPNEPSLHRMHHLTRASWDQ